MTTDYFAGDPRSQRERMMAGDLYLADDPELEAALQLATELADRYHKQVLAKDPSATDTLHQLFGEVGEDIWIRPPLYVDYGTNIYIGPRTAINFNLTALDVAEIRIGADCLIGPNRF